jgi:outer membrane receptor protein involved in Fe transport
MAEGGTSGSDWGIYATTSFLNTDTYRNDENHKQQHFSVRFDKYLNNNDMLKTIVVYGNADLTGISGPMRLREADYQTNKALNYYPISYIDTSSLLVATTYEKEWAKSSISITPFFRKNGFETIINNNPVTNNYVFKDEEKSYGINTRFRHDFDTWKTRLNTGVDVETNPGSYQERVINITRETLSSGASRTLGYTETGAMNYDYKATYSSISPYAQTEFSPFQSIPLRFTTGMRYDYIMWDYQNKLSTKTTNCVFSNGLVCRPESTDLEFSRASPKLGVVYNINKQHDIFANYSEGFRSPYHSNLFRSGANGDTVNLQPIVAKQKEIGIRGNTNSFAYSLSLFDIAKTNDIIFARNPDTTIAATNSGKTSHTGVEVSTALQLTDTLKTNVSYTYIKHKYDYWVSSNVDFSGKDMEGAPREISNVALIYTPAWLKGGSVMGEWYHASDMYGNSANVIEGRGGKYDIVNIKANYFITPKVELFTRVLNAADKDYTNSITYNSTTAQKEYFVAPPRTVYFGATYHF